MLRVLLLLLACSVAIGAQASRPMVVYYESWSADSTAADIQQLPAYVTHLVIAFAKPNAQYNGNLDLSGSGLNLPYSGSALKDAVKQAKQQHPSLKILLAVGGATYHEWQALNAAALVRLVSDIGLDGIDIDYEVSPPNAQVVNNVTQTLRDALPRDKTLTMAVMHVAAYGRDAWAQSQPTGSAWTGFFHEIAPALQDIDMIHVMSYDAGSTYNVQEAYAAFRYYYEGVIAMGMEVPPEAWGAHVWTVAKVEAMANDLLLGSNTDGLMLWSMHKDNDTVSDTDPQFPSANLLAQTACEHLLLGSAETCAQQLINDKQSTLVFRNDSNENGVYMMVDAMPYGYPRTESLNKGEEGTLTGEQIPVINAALPVYVYATSIGYETACLDAVTKKNFTIAWEPENMRRYVIFWVDNNKRPLCSAR